MRVSYFPTVLVPVVVLLTSASLQARDTLVLDAVRDNVMYQDNANNSNGSGDFLFAGQNGGGSPRRSLIRFDLSAIPDQAVIDSVTITLFMSQSGAGDTEVSFHRLLADWGESTSDASGGEGGGAPAQMGDATWNDRFFPGIAWANAGGDFVAEASATITVGGVGDYDWGSGLLASDVQTWLDGDADNFGWLLIGDESTAATSKRFNSRSNAAGVPQLTVQFTVVPEPTSLVVCILVTGFSLSRRRRH
jgi:hypothetical protein